MDQGAELRQTKIRRARWQIAFLVGILGVVLPILGIIGGIVSTVREFYKHFDRKEVPIRSITDLERRFRVSFPPETVLVEGRAMFGFAGGQAVAMVRMPEKALAPFLAQPAIQQDLSDTSGTRKLELRSEAKIAAELAKVAAGPGKRLTTEEFDHLDGNLMLPSERSQGRAKAWKLDQIRHFYQAETYVAGGHTLTVFVNLDDPAVPILYLIYFYI